MISLLLLVGGCASTRPVEIKELQAGQTVFQRVGVLDFRKDDLEDYRSMVRPGDLIVNYMRLGRAVKKKEWLFAVVPHGHSMIVLDPNDPKGLLECRFRGMQRVGPEELSLYSYNTVYRLRDSHRLNFERLGEFSDHGSRVSRKYSFASWLALNDNLRPQSIDQISHKYTCSTAMVAAYYYSGVTLSVSRTPNRVITPQSLIASVGTLNQYAVCSRQ